MSFFLRAAKTTLVDADRALPGRDTRLGPIGPHTVLGTQGDAPVAEHHEELVVGMGCFWGAERIFWQLPGVVTTAVGYAGGHTPNPTYEEVCSARTAHTEVVRVVFDPAVTSREEILRAFWEGHDPTQGMAQGNDVGTQYRSAVYATTPEQLAAAQASRDAYDAELSNRGFTSITTEIAPLDTLYYAEDYHQQYLSDAKNPNGYCGIGGTGVSCPIGLGGATS